MVSFNAIRDRFAMKLASKPRGLSMTEFNDIVSEFIDTTPSDNPSTEMRNAMYMMSIHTIYQDELAKAEDIAIKMKDDLIKALLAKKRALNSEIDDQIAKIENLKRMNKHT